MAYANGFNGDVVQLSYIQQTLEDKLYAIPGVTCDDALSMNVSGQDFNYWVRSAANVGNAALGSKVQYESTGSKRVNCTFEKGKQIYEVIPNVNYATVSADVVGDKVIQDTIIVANQMNEEFVQKVASTTHSAASWAASTGEDPYNAILRLRSEFVKANADHNVRPTACLVSSDLYSALLAKNILIFKDGKKFGELLGFPVIEVPSLDSSVTATTLVGDLSDYAKGDSEHATAQNAAAPFYAGTSGVAAIMLNAKAMISAENINTLMVTDATPAGYPNGTLIAGEIGYYIEPSELFVYGEAKKNGDRGDVGEPLIIKMAKA